MQNNFFGIIVSSSLAMLPMNQSAGKYQESIYGDETVQAFVPHPLPPAGLRVDPAKVDEAVHCLEKLDFANNLSVFEGMFVHSFMHKEAVETSWIEGIQTSLADLLGFEPGKAGFAGKRSLDAMEARNYLVAMEYAVQELAKPDGLPLSMRLLNNAHLRLMDGPRGRNKCPGKLRKVQNCLAGGGPRSSWFFPPPPSAVPGLLSDLENFIHGDSALHPLVRIGMVHVQFETIHPYLDGNGRMGRLLIALLLSHWGLLDDSILFLSLYLRRHRNEYYKGLSEVRSKGNWEEWIDFFLDGVIETTNEATGLAAKLNKLVYKDRERLYAQQSTTMPAMRLFTFLPRHPIISVKQASEMLGTAQMTASKAIDRLVAADILAETTGKRSGRKFMYRDYVVALN